MKKLIVGLMLVLSACNVGAPSSIPIAAPVPLASKTIDDTALNACWKAFDVALDAIALLREKGVIKVGSPKALAIANGIDRTSAALQAAEHAVAAGSTTNYLTALNEARLALTDIRVAIKGN